MKKYAVAFIDFFENDLKLEVIENVSELEAAFMYMFKHQINHMEAMPIASFTSVDELDEWLNQCEAAIRVKELV